jgi:tripartite-type tricarboxylate transporter receptor subunit TctC
MYPPRRALLALPVLAPIAASARAVDRPARLLVGFAPGGSADVVGRLLADHLRHTYAPQVIVENRSGAGGRLAVEAAKSATPDGATILLSPAGQFTILPHIEPGRLRYDSLTDFLPVTPVCFFSYGFAIAANHPAQDLEGFARWARERGRITFASPAAGSVGHFIGLRLGEALGINMVHVPYRGTVPALNDLMAGQIDATVSVVGEASELHRAGRLRMLACTAARRSSGLPSLPTFAEMGQPALTEEQWFGLFLPAGTPEAVVAALWSSTDVVLRAPAVAEVLAAQEYRLVTEEPAAFRSRVEHEYRRWQALVERLGFRVQD